MRTHIAAALLAGALALPAYGQTAPNLELRMRQYMEPVHQAFSVDVRALYARMAERLKDRTPNPLPIILHEPVEEALRGESPPVLMDAVEAHLNQLARFRAHEGALSASDPAQTLVPAYDFGGITDVRYTTNARISDASGRGTDALCAYFTLLADGHAYEYRVLVPLIEVERVTDDGVTYLRRTYDKVLGVVQVRKGEKWKDVENPTLERLADGPKRMQDAPRMPDASQAYMP